MINIILEKVFSCLPFEMVKVSSLQKGDVTKLHNNWDIVRNTEQTQMQQKRDFCVNGFSGCGYYFSPSEEVRVVNRKLFNQDALQSLIADFIREEEEIKRLEEDEYDDENYG